MMLGDYVILNINKELLQLVDFIIYDFDGNKMIIRPKEKVIKLDGNGRGKFRLNIKLELNNIQGYKTLTDNLSIKVRYVD